MKNYIPNRNIEDNILNPDTRLQAVNDIYDYLQPGNHTRNPNGMGQIMYRNRYQYIRDKCLMLKNEFLCNVCKADVEFLIYKCPTIADIDAYCRKIIYREWPNDIDVEVK